MRQDPGADMDDSTAGYQKHVDQSFAVEEGADTTLTTLYVQYPVFSSAKVRSVYFLHTDPRQHLSSMGV